MVLSSPIYMDLEGNQVLDELLRVGLKQEIMITKPSYILFADASGFSTSQKKDGHVGGEKLVVERGSVAQVMASTTDHKFTLLPFTSASGEAVCCMVIFQSKKGNVPFTRRTGIDHTINPILTVDGKEIVLN